MSDDVFALAGTAPPEPPTILAVDDEPWNLTLVEAVLEGSGFRLATARDGVEAIEKVAASKPDLVLLDVMMPRLDGFEVCRRLKADRATFFVPIVMLTALSDAGSKVRGLEAGADDFLNKPINRIELLTRLKALLRIRRLRDELDSTESVMLSMVAALEGKAPRTRGHSLRVGTLASALALDLGLEAPVREAVTWAALLHDIGKLGVPEDVLAKPDRERTPDERRLYRFHLLHGERILAPLGSLSAALPLVRHHHERLDGSGFPNQLRGDAFTTPMEIVAAANAWDGYRIADPDDPAAGEAGLGAEVARGAFRPQLVERLLRVAAALPAEPPSPASLLPAPSSPSSGRILIADDTVSNHALYEAVLADAGFETKILGGGRALLDALEHESADLVILDVRMPDLSGEQVCRRIKTDPRHPFMPVILVTAHEEATSRDRALAAGAEDFLTLPLNRQELVARVRSLVRLRAYHHDLVRHESVVLSLSGAIEAKDPYTNGHSARVADLATAIAEEMRLGPFVAATMRTGGLLHDVGKVAVPERILHKPGALDREEMAVLMTHPAVGWEICRHLRSVAAALPCIRHHHERWDGSGYPDGLAGEAIPLGARIMGIADAFDALTSERPYRAALTPEAAVDLLRHEVAQGKWDPAPVDALAALFASGRLSSRDPA